MTTTASATPLERSRKACARILLTLRDDVKQSVIASEMGVSESEVSRIKKDIDKTLDVLYLAGYKVVPATDRSVDSETFDAVSLITSKAMSNPRIAREVMSGAEE